MSLVLDDHAHLVLQVAFVEHISQHNAAKYLDERPKTADFGDEKLEVNLFVTDDYHGLSAQDFRVKGLLNTKYLRVNWNIQRGTKAVHWLVNKVHFILTEVDEGK